jgi:hypothetical protein
MRLGLVAAASLGLAGSAAAQPRDPYADPPAGSEQVAPADPVMAEQIAQSLVARAQELLEARVWLDAKQLAVEAIVRSPKGPSADHARMIVKQVNQQLGIPDEPAPGDIVGPHDTPPIVPPPIEPPGVPITHDQPELGSPVVVANVHGGMYGATIGAMLGTLVSSDGGKQAGGAVAFGIGGALAGALAAPKLVDKLGWSGAQVRTAGAGSTWGGVTGAFIADIGTGTTGTSGRQVMIGIGIGATVGAVAGGALASQNKLSRGDVALVDTFAGMGLVGGLTIGMLMQPVESEAYSLNAIVGAAGGIVVGLVAAPQTNTTPRRMLRVAAAAGLGAAIPFLLYAAIHDSSTDSDERLVGALATGGIVAGAYVGFRLTRGMDEGWDTVDGKKAKVDDAPPAAVTRSSTGSWNLGGVALQPLSRTLDDHQHGTGLTVLGGSF